jgi:hypothetical protein
MTVRVAVHDDELVVSLAGWDAWWALKRSIDVPMASVRSVEVWDDPFADAWRGLRLPGTSVPGYRAGSYRRREEWRFYVVRAGHSALTLDLANHRYSKIIVRTEAPEADRERLAPLAGRSEPS